MVAIAIVTLIILLLSTYVVLSRLRAMPCPIWLSWLVGPGGNIVAADIQSGMLRRAKDKTDAAFFGNRLAFTLHLERPP
jgi:hypothetical protein